MAKVRARFAPSPTGSLHIGGVRTALFNWLFARHHGGAFILRIEDTDPERSKDEWIEQITDGLHWLGLDWDEGPDVGGPYGPYRQRDRMANYRGTVDRLLEEGKAYRCMCTRETLEEKKRQALKGGKPYKYDGTCRELRSVDPGVPHVIRFRSTDYGRTVVRDLVRGEVTFENAQLDDLVLLRSDGTPTYNFSAVVDDVAMAITHVIRGEDHLNNTPRQVQIYRALGAEVPVFAHISMIHGQDKTKLSKRHGATSVTEYRDQGYLAHALVNYLARLGWSHGDQEIFSREELIEKFDLDRVVKSPAVFNPEKLLWLNAHYIASSEKSGLRELFDRLEPFLKSQGTPWRGAYDEPRFEKFHHALKGRSHTLVELADGMRPFLADDVAVDPAARQKFLKPEIAPALEALAADIEALDRFETAVLEAMFKALLERRGMKMSELAQPVRVALTGRTVSPGIIEVMDLLGQETTLRRLRAAVRVISS